MLGRDLTDGSLLEDDFLLLGSRDSDASETAIERSEKPFARRRLNARHLGISTQDADNAEVTP